MCEQRERVLDYLYDEASPAGRREVEQHLESCDTCRDDIRAFRRVREDLLAWDVPNQSSVWTPFAPAPVVPWHRQVPAWAMAAAASLMLLLGAAGGGVAAYALGGTRDAGGSGVVAASAPAAPQAAAWDAPAIESLVRRELASAGLSPNTQPAPVVTPAAAFRADPATEQRLLARATQLVGASEERQLALVRGFLFEVAREADRQRKDDGQALGALRAQVDQLQAVLNQLVLQQTKVQ